MLQNLVAGYASFAEDITGFRTAVPFLILFAGLVVLGRRRRRAAGTAAADPPPAEYLAGEGVGPPPLGRVAGRGRAPRHGVYTVTTPFWSGILAQGLAIGLVFMSFTVVTGLGAMVSLAQATFVTGSALVAGLLMSHGWPFVAAAAAGTAAAALLGAVVALPALRLGGRSLALATLALAFLGQEGAEVHPDAVLRGPLYIGDYAKVEAGAEIREHTVIGSNVVVKSGAFLHKAVIHDNVYIGQQCNLRGCVIGKNTDIMRAARIEDGAVIGDECLVGEESIVQGNVRVYPFKTIEAGAFVNTSVIWESRGQAHLFGARGVSGILNVEITPELAVRLAGAYATTLKKGSTVTTRAATTPGVPGR
ncbi:UDP-3-O-(3-hydroxymyristoyl)glucosamine N-acyltransferase [Streptomyces tanashiensis]